MARPKTGNKIQVNLTIEKEAIGQAKKVAEESKMSLSQLTEDCYYDVARRFYGLKENPENMLREIQNQIKLIEEGFIKKEEETKKSK